MHVDTARVVAEGLLKGVFDVLDAMLSKSFKYELLPPEELSLPQLTQWLGQFPVALRGTVKNNLGAAAVLFSVADASRMASMILETGGKAKEALDNDDRNVLKEVAEPALGGGVTNLMERFGHPVEQLAEVLVTDTGIESAAAIMEALGEASGVARFRFTEDSEWTGEAALLFSGSLMALAPASAAEPREDLAAAPKLSPEEMSDILNGFGPEAAAAPLPARTPEGYHNLDMILDIRLRATARLGRVQLPLADILNFGPGSVIEVGHLVDEPIELLINDKLIARGDVVVVDEKFGLRITEIVSTKERIESLR